MRDITVIIPTTRLSYTEDGIKMLANAVGSAERAADNYKDGKVEILVVIPSGVKQPEKQIGKSVRYIENSGETDYCSQVNFAVGNVKTEYFSILEHDDQYSDKWFKDFGEYYVSHEDISIFLPVNVLHNADNGNMEFVNEIVWAASFSDEIGFIDHDCLDNCSLFNLTGGIFKTSDWLGYKPSVKVAFNYEYLLRATGKKQSVFVIPKEGYRHEIFREGSLSAEYLRTVPDSEAQEWFSLAKRESAFDEDRKKTVIMDKTEELK